MNHSQEWDILKTRLRASVTLALGTWNKRKSADSLIQVIIEIDNMANISQVDLFIVSLGYF